MLTRNKDVQAVLKAMLVAFLVAGIPFLGVGLVLTEIDRGQSIEERNDDRRPPPLEPGQGSPVRSRREAVGV